MKSTFPSLKIRLVLVVYTVVWVLLFPLALTYLFVRARKDPEYRQHLAERFGIYNAHELSDPVWIHAVSMGETIAVAPLVRALLSQGDSVVFTHFTPAGRRTSAKLFGDSIAAGKVAGVYVPFEYDWVFGRFFKTFRPKYGLIVESDIWPRMIASSRNRRVPLMLCNGQFPKRSVDLDRRLGGIRSGLMLGLTGVLAKSTIHAQRFRDCGMENVAVTGELRFDQPVPQRLLDAATTFRADSGFSGRKVVALTSAVADEQDLHVNFMKNVLQAARSHGLSKPLFVYVPREPERFAGMAGDLAEAGLTAVARSAILDNALSACDTVKLTGVDVLVGDSLGEMFFYLAISDLVIAGRSFVPAGSHNVIEPLLLGKLVVAGPYTWNIEYPSVEALDAGVLLQLQTPADLEKYVLGFLQGAVDLDQFAARKAAFLLEHAGATGKCLDALPKILEVARKDLGG